MNDRNAAGRGLRSGGGVMERATGLVKAFWGN